MRILIYKERNGKRNVLIRPAKDEHKPLVLLQGVGEGEAGAAVKKALEPMS